MNYETLFYAILGLFLVWLVYRSYAIFREGFSTNRIGKVIFLIFTFCIVSFFLMMGSMGVISGLANS